jgi:transaldolase
MKLRTLGQSIWLDYIQCDLIVSGELWRLFVYDGLRGMTSNPSIFKKAIAGSHDYDEDIRVMVSDGKGVKAIYEALSQRDVQSAVEYFSKSFDKLMKTLEKAVQK